MVPTAPSRSCERATENPERQAPRPLPVLRTTHELPRYSAVLPESPLHLAGMAEPADTWKAADVGKVCRNPTSVPAAATSDHTGPGGSGESRLKNPLREICTVGSVRGEIPDEPWWTQTGTKLETADTAKGSLQLAGTPLLGKLCYRLFTTFTHT